MSPKSNKEQQQHPSSYNDTFEGLFTEFSLLWEGFLSVPRATAIYGAETKYSTHVFYSKCVSKVLGMVKYQNRVTSQKTRVLSKTTVRTQFLLCELLKYLVATRC